LRAAVIIQVSPAIRASGLRASADHRFVERHEHVLADDRTVVERHAHRVVAQADLDAGQVARDQRAGDAAVFLLADQVVRVLQAEGEADQGGDGCQRDVALLPVRGAGRIAP
jgi:hypothetical protein